MRAVEEVETQAGGVVTSDELDAEQLRRLEAVCLEDMALLAGVSASPIGRLALERAIGGRVRRFARDVAGFDRAVGRVGVAAAATELAGRYGSAIEIAGPGRAPTSGPTLLLANHPGLADTLAIYATVGRDDLRALARPQPILRLLPEMGRHLLIVPDAGPNRAGAVRATLRHLREGGAALLFPAGHLEPEPSIVSGSVDPLGSWSPSVGTLVRIAARHEIPLRVVPTAVSGVLAGAVWRRFGPLIRRRRTLQGRADLAALLQLVFPRLGSTTVRVRYGEPLDAMALAASGEDSAALTERVKGELYALLGRPERAACA